MRLTTGHENDTILILGRGSSMVLADKYYYDLTNEMIIINEFNEEVKTEWVHRLFEEKDLMHIVSRDSGLSNLTPENYSKYNMNDAILNIFNDEFSGGTAMKNLLQSRGMNLLCLPDELKPYAEAGGGFPTTGIISIVYSAAYLGKTDIHIAGMDFYEEDYYSGQVPTEAQRAKGVRMTNFITSFMAKFPKTNFTFYTHSSFTSDLDNVTIVNE
jgi:hypothetical protein